MLETQGPLSASVQVGCADLMKSSTSLINLLMCRLPLPSNLVILKDGCSTVPCVGGLELDVLGLPVLVFGCPSPVIVFCTTGICNRGAVLYKSGDLGVSKSVPSRGLVCATPTICASIANCLLRVTLSVVFCDMYCS